MKLIAGVVLAAAVAGVAAVSLPGRGAPPLPSPPKGPPKHEYIALVNAYGDLDGPAKEAIGFRGDMTDAAGNLWGKAGWLRVSDSRVMKLRAYRYGTLGFDLKEGPLVGRPVTFIGGSYGWPCGGSALIGRPDVGGKTDGIYEAIGREGKLIRIWKNKEKGDRWWFARVAGGGAAAAPRTRGQSAGALAVKFKWLNMPQVGLDGKLRFMADNAFYLLEDGKVTCVLSPDDYKAATAAMKGLPNECYFGGDGTFYLGYYYVNKGAYEGTGPALWRITPDGKVEPYATNIGKGHSGGGDTLTQAGWYCGPHLGRSNAYSACRFIPPDAVLTSAHDEDMIRRIRKGRVSTLCVNGEWREFGKGLGHGRTELYAAQRAFGPNGTLYYARRPWQEMRLYRYTGLDFHKPTVNKRAK